MRKHLCKIMVIDDVDVDDDDVGDDDDDVDVDEFVCLEL